MEGEGSLFLFDLSRLGFQPQKVFDILQKDVSEETFHDKPSWAGPESKACNWLHAFFLASLSNPRPRFSFSSSLHLHFVLRKKVVDMFKGGITAAESKIFTRTSGAQKHCWELGDILHTNMIPILQ